ncbi:MAG: STAS domain-containing protein [Actinomycetota bacterium]|nr:STAS domain-containing protein [Actinomycetota bacterium]
MTELSLLGRADQTVRVALGDPPTSGLGDLRWQLAGLLGGGTNTLVIDVSRLDRLSSAWVATLLGVKRTCHARRIRVVLADPSNRTREVLTRTGLASVFEIES